MSKINKRTMLNISGSSSSDVQVASDFCIQVTKQADELEKIIDDIEGLDVILSNASLCSVRDALAGLRHIDQVVSQLAAFHQAGQLGAALDNLLKKVASQRASAEKKYNSLQALYPV